MNPTNMWTVLRNILIDRTIKDEEMVMNIFKKTLPPIILVMTLVGCAPSARITYDYDEAIDFTAYETFDWMAPPGDIEDPLGAFPTVAFRIKNSIQDELREKGYSKVNEDPDFYVVYHASIKRQITRTYIDTWGYYYPRYHRYPPHRRYPPGLWGSIYVEAYEEGTLVIDIIDAATNELAWRGAARGAVGNRAMAREKIDEGVRVILEHFPPYRIERKEVRTRISASVN